MAILPLFNRIGNEYGLSGNENGLLGLDLSTGMTFPI